ncbi:MAG: hypothetical protein MMC23_008573 [Stictis urceolatum]|nr:hypothetical protein [Stictis urceolata]
MSTPPSSPPSEDKSDQDYDPVSERMLREEQRMQEKSKRNEKNEQKRATGWSNANEVQQKSQFDRLKHLVEQSKVFASVMQTKMQKEEVANEKKSAAEKKKIEKQEAQAEKAAVVSQRKSTRGTNGNSESLPNGMEQSPSKKLPTRGRGRPKKSEQNGSISSWLKKEELESKTGGMTVAEAVAEAAGDHDIATDGFGATNLRSANQPKELTGGIMRNYQLEGLFWLRTLYENGLNGILADEMGLGKTIQTISFLAFLREKKVYGPFLIVAPLSTLGNWIDEFARWTPNIRTSLYHGPPADRARIRDTELIEPGSKDFPVVCTSYEICMNDRKFLSKYGWKYIIIDEGHRLKNLNCRLIKELKQYDSANRLLITGTPLQNNLAELWSLLNFLMPDIFDTLENFESFFDFSAVLEKNGHKQIIEQEEQNNLVASLHAILKPFLLRRVKTDVETDLPKKREYILYAPLTNEQKELYKQIIEGNSRSYLEHQAVERILEKKGEAPFKQNGTLKRKQEDGTATPTSNKSAKSSRASTPGSVRSLPAKKGRPRKSYKEISDAQYFKEIQESSESEEESEEDEEAVERAKTIELAKKEIANKKLQNPIMQLRLACNSPHNFYWPWANDETPDADIVNASGKMLMLERLIPYLFKKGHKVLIFSQFKTQLDILEDWAGLVHDWPVCRIDGSIAQEDRRQMIKDFNTKKNVKLFLLSTRAGGQGINLAAADTVILFDSDWNPQQDLQAQDRAHRIGQTRPVIVYRLATKGTVEQTLLEKADGKRRLEKLVIRKGKFKSLKGGAGQDDMAELARILETDDFEGFNAEEGLLSEEDLKALTDRSEEAYMKAEKGEGETDKFRTVETRKDAGVLEGVTRK